MKALILEGPCEFRYADLPDPSPAPDEVLIGVQACGICGSDVHGMDGSSGRRRPPIVMGHEAAGTVAAVGDSVSDWPVGTRVTFDSTISCGSCNFCRRGQINLCDHRQVLGVSCDEYRRNGAFAEYVVVPERVLYRLPDGLSFEKAAFTEPAAVALHAVRRAAPEPGSTAVVVGAGMIGLLIVQALREAGCGPIIAVDLDEYRLALAGQFGATKTVDARTGDAVTALHEATDSRGADVVLEAVGHTDAVRTAIGAARKGGAVVLVGNLSPQVELPLQQVVTRELNVLGSCAIRDEYPDALAMLADGRIDTEPLISAVAPLPDGADWFARLYRREDKLMKVILQPNPQEDRYG